MWSELELSKIDIRLKKLLSEVSELYNDLDVATNKSLYEHGLTHIGRVLGNVLEICIDEKVEQNAQVLILAAAICHDLGYFICSDGHVFESSKMAPVPLQKNGFVASEINIIQQIILAHSSVGKIPENLLEGILRVADKCELLGFDGIIRVILLQPPNCFDNRDELALDLLDKSSDLYSRLKKLKVGSKFLEKRWDETRSFLEEILSRKFLYSSKVNC